MAACIIKMAGEKGKEKDSKVDQALLDEDDDFEEFMTEGMS